MTQFHLSQWQPREALLTQVVIAAVGLTLFAGLLLVASDVLYWALLACGGAALFAVAHNWLWGGNWLADVASVSRGQTRRRVARAGDGFLLPLSERERLALRYALEHELTMAPPGRLDDDEALEEILRKLRAPEL